MTSVINHWINGELQPSTSERYGDVFNPATGEVSASVTMGNSDDLEKAVESASKAFETWSQTSVTKRAQIFFKYKELLESNREELIDLITAEHGKVAADAAGSLQRGIEVVDFVCGIPHLLKGEFGGKLGRALIVILRDSQSGFVLV